MLPPPPRADGRIGHAGFSLHDHYQVLRTIAQSYDAWALCSVDYNYIDVDHNPGSSGIAYAAGQGLAVVVTAPFKGGSLCRTPPAEAQAAWAATQRPWSRAEWALRFVLNHPGVSVAVNSVTDTRQFEENLAVAGVAEAGGLSVADEVTLGKVRDAFLSRREVLCPSCRPCLPCPQGIDIPRFFEIYNAAAMFGNIDEARAMLSREGIFPETCSACRLCESRCAKRLPIVELLEAGTELLER